MHWVGKALTRLIQCVTRQALIDVVVGHCHTAGSIHLRGKLGGTFTSLDESPASAFDAAFPLSHRYSYPCSVNAGFPDSTLHIVELPDSGAVVRRGRRSEIRVSELFGIFSDLDGYG